MKKFIIFFLLFLSLGQVNAQEVHEQALFVWALDKNPILSSHKQIDDLIDFSKKFGIKTLFVQVYRANQAWFPSQVADTTPYKDCYKSVGEDAFGLLIHKAHKAGIEVHAWLNLLSLSANKDAPIIKKYGPGILTRNVEDKKTIEDYSIDRQYFLEPGDPRVKAELTTIVGELVNAYPDLDGIQFDYIRYPDVHPFYGYTPNNMERFKKMSGQKKIVEQNPLWKQWKRDRVTELLEALVKQVRSIRPKIHISTTGCLSYTRAYHEAFQDWPSWINRNLVEFVTVMNYPPDFSEFKKNIMEIKEKVADFKKVNIAVGAYKFETGSPNTFNEQYNYCQNSGAKSCVVFHYSSMLVNPALEQPLKKK